MKKIIKEVDEKRGIVQVTIADERWYMKSQENLVTRLPEFVAVPSVTWIGSFYPKGVGYYKWLGEHGWDESQAIMREAGEKGDKVHQALSSIFEGNEVRIDSAFLNKGTGQMEELTFEECECIKSFMDWKATLKSFKPILWDYTLFSEKHNYAGSLDLLALVDGEPWLIDFKTSQQVWPSHELQVSAYREAIVFEDAEVANIKVDGKRLPIENLKTAILQVGYQRTKSKFKFTEIENKFALFMHAKAIWANECDGQSPRKVDLPIVLSPALTVADVINAPEVAVEVAEEVDVKLPAQDKNNESIKGNNAKGRATAKTAARD